MNTAAFTSALSHFSADWLLIGAVALAMVLYSLWRSSTPAVTIALCAPLTLILSEALPHAQILGPVSQQFGTNSAILFLAVFVVLFLLVYRITASFSEGGGVLEALLAGLSSTAILALVWIQVPALQSLWHFGPQIQNIFGETYRFWWLLVAYAALAFARG
jgi:hypothetical protein